MSEGVSFLAGLPLRTLRGGFKRRHRAQQPHGWQATGEAWPLRRVWGWRSDCAAPASTNRWRCTARPLARCSLVPPLIHRLAPTHPRRESRPFKHPRRCRQDEEEHSEHDHAQ